MSHFTLKNQPVRKKRKGIWLRVRSETINDVNEAIQKSKLKRTTEVIQWIEIHELRDNGKVLLEVWCQSMTDIIKGTPRFNVFHLLIDENLEWTCEGDLGRGLK